MDHLGPFKTTRGGKKHILMCIDYLTKYVEAASVADTTTALVIEFIRENINFRHGVVTRIISDQGTAFSSHLMEDNVKEWGTHHVFATAEHPQTSGLVERVNRTMTQALAAYVNTDHDDWDRHLPAAVFAINTARQSTVEISPFQLVYGRLATSLHNIGESFPVAERTTGTFRHFSCSRRRTTRSCTSQHHQKTGEVKTPG